ncbi:periplasmic heavy metal sensor [Aestuariibacter halophilus]|uniref:Signaling pathway modulator ZraP n=1 Tax=Fluctibacter halophilus TaxID=226011 RepID=A0ABS8GC64_9ALTE|nr:periplasmic heavy metal sensor [Aestuariibacter halophilus]MCC2617364.1 periplasmic heavy metal sensor [Aestuariibacter halophilus]
MKPSSLFFTLSVVSSTVFSAIAFAHGPDRGEHGPLAALKQLDLSANQRADVRQLVREARADSRDSKDDMRLLREQLRDTVQTSDWDADTVTALLSQQQTLMDSIALQKAITGQQIWALLTDAQQQQWLADMPEANEPRQRDHDRLLDKLNVSDAQREALEPLLSALDQQRQSLIQARQNWHSSERALIQQDSFDQSAWTAARAQSNAVILPQLQEQLHLRQQVWQQLSSEQQDQLAQMMRRHGDKGPRGRHHSTRRDGV